MTYAYIEAASGRICLTDDDVIDFRGTVQYEEDSEEVQSLTFIKDGGAVDGEHQYSLKTTIVCDPLVTGAPQTVSVDATTDPY